MPASDNRMDFSKQFINGEWTASARSSLLPVENPATREIFAHIPEGAPEDAGNAFAAARAAFPAWASTRLEERIGILLRAAERLSAKRLTIAELETKELGAPYAYALKKHCDYQIARIPAYVECARRLKLLERTPGAFVRLEPVGVASCITPWNYPLGQIVQKIVPALLMGNTVVLKPSSQAPLTACLLAQALSEAGCPPGVFNMISGSAAAYGDILATHPDLDMISFTGSTAVGRRIGALAGANLKKVCLELGGKSPALWLPGMPEYVSACRTLFNSIFLNSGQTCTALSRLILPESLLDDAKRAFLEVLPEYPVGDPAAEGTVLGPLVSRRHYERVADYIRLGVEEKAELFAGRVPEPLAPSQGCYVEPVIFTNVAPSMRIAQEEIFGPVLCVTTVKDVEEAVAVANGTPYGLSSAVYGPEAEALAVARRIDAGNVFVNNARRDVTAPFGGFKTSGLGYESGEKGLLEYVRFKSVFIPAGSAPP